MKHVIFVYGTLLSGLSLHSHMAGARWLGAGRVRARLLDLGDYPGMVCVGQDDPVFVHGEVYEVEQALLNKLDAVEEYDPQDEPHSLYLRRACVLHEPGPQLPRTVWAYLFNRSVASCKEIPDGNYRAYLTDQARLRKGAA